jgi:hypothetical protein
LREIFVFRRHFFYPLLPGNTSTTTVSFCCILESQQHNSTMIDPADTADLQLEDVEDYNADYPPIGFPQGDENIHTSGGGLNKPRYRRGALRNLLTRNKWATGFAAILVLICIVTISVVAGGGKSSNKSGSPFGSSAKNQAPIVIDPDSLDPAYTGPLLIELKDAYGRHGLDPSVLDKEAGTTPQRHAFYWMATDEELKNFDHTETIQRYAMAVLYYATNSVPNDEVEETIPWIDGTGWLSDAHVCEGWRGIECNGQMHVKAITLKENRLTGSLPQELALLSQNLESIDLSTNMIIMEGDMYDVFKTLDQLETLILDDNYMKSSNGLPYQFKHLKKLEKLRMSYNLLGGELETEDRKVLKHLGALTHLELESNFLTGNMPPDISGLTDLVYLYMRRNEMEFNLDFLKGGTLVELCKCTLTETKGLEIIFYLYLTYLFPPFLAFSRRLVGRQ